MLYRSFKACDVLRRESPRLTCSVRHKDMTWALCLLNKLIFKSKDWYLYGFCLLRNDYRFFKLTRIKDLMLLPETFLRRKEDVPELKPTIQQERLISVRLKFSPAAAFRVYDEFTDTVERDAQGSLHVTVDVPERTLYSYILSYGDAAEILEPDELRRSMKEKLTRMAEKYKT